MASPSKITSRLAAFAAGLAVVGGALITAQPAAAASCTSYSYGPGGTGTCVLYIQRIVSIWTPSMARDGRYGNETFEAVKKFQRLYGGGLAQDGWVGPQTWKALCVVAKSESWRTESYTAGRAAGCGY